MDSPGTPKTLKEAIANGFKVSETNPDKAQNILYSYVKDFLSQKFTIAQLGNPSVKAFEELWKEITKV